MDRSKNKSFLYQINPSLLFILLTAMITGLAMLTSFQPIYANIPINIILPIIVLLKLKTVFFEKLKLTTLLVMRTLIVIAALGYLNGTFYTNLVLIFLGINILEATLTDFKKKKYFNVATGIALTASIFLIKGTWLGHYYEATTEGVVGMILWIIAYTIWNWIFVTNEFSSSIAKFHVGVLAAPILGIIFKVNPALWLIFRGNSLTIAGVLQIANKEFLEEELENPGFDRFVKFTQKTNIQIICMLVNFALLLGTVIIATK